MWDSADQPAAVNPAARLLLDHLTDVVAVVDIAGRITYVTGPVESLFGITAERAVGRSWIDLSVGSDRAAAAALLGDAVREHRRTGELQMLGRNGATRFVDVTVVAPPEGAGSLVISHHDATERHLLQTHLIDQAFHDPLTGLANRVLFRDRLGRALTGARMSGERCVVMIIDLDDFKNVNDSLGHPAGDLLLRSTAQRVATCIRAGDTAARTGGDEFAVILDDPSSVAEGSAVAGRILEAIRAPLQVADTELMPSATVGVAFADGSVDADEAERQADLALYEAKRLGKGRAAFYRPEFHQRALARLQEIGELRQAIARAEFVPRFQPIIGLDDGGIAGVECLARWEHPSRGVLAPDDFLGAAYENGLIEQLDRTMLRQALRALSGWRRSLPAHRDLRLTVNVSPQHLLSRGFLREVRQELLNADVPPELLVLEVTESTLLPDDAEAVARMADLRALGVTVFVDDFGTGWSSLRSLHNLSFDGLKLAQDFVTRLPEPTEVAVAQAIRDLAVATGVTVLIAEGIEQVEQRRVLLALGFRLGQGHLLSRPLTAAECGDLLLSLPPSRWDAVGAVDIDGPETQLPRTAQSPSRTR